MAPSADTRQPAAAVLPSTAADPPPALASAAPALATVLTQPAPATALTQPASASAQRDARLLTFSGHVRAALHTILGPADRRCTRRVSLRGHWRHDTPIFARCCADVLDLLSGVLPPFRITGPGLRQQEQEVQELTLQRAQLQSALKEVDAALAGRKRQLFDDTMLVIDEIEALGRLQMLPEALRQQVERTGGMIFRLLQTRNARTEARRRHRADLRAQAQAEVDEVAAQLALARREVQILRGATGVSAAAPPQGPVAPSRDRE